MDVFTNFTLINNERLVLFIKTKLLCLYLHLTLFINNHSTENNSMYTLHRCYSIKRLLLLTQRYRNTYLLIIDVDKTRQ